MIAGPISGWVGKLTAVSSHIPHKESIHIYGNVFGSLGLFVAFVAFVALFMWIIRPKINNLLSS